MPKAELQMLLVEDLAAWSHWLLRHASASPGVWLVMAKKGTTTPTSLTLSQALDEALCFGWINGQAKSRDAGTVMQRYTPRTAKSTWSQINQGHVARLEAEGRMQARGRDEVEKAKADGRWEAAYGRFSTMEAPEELRVAMEGEEGGREKWEGLSKGERYAVLMRLANLRTEAGRERLIKKTVDGLREGEVGKPHKGMKRKAADLGVVEKDVRPSPSPLRESRAERAERRATRLGTGAAAS